MVHIISVLVKISVKLMMFVHKMKSSTFKLLCLFLLFNSSLCAQSLTSLTQVSAVANIDTSLPTSGGLIYGSDAHIFQFDVGTQLATVNLDLGQLDQAGIDGFHKTGDGCGDSIYSLDNTAMISGTAMRSADVFTAAGVKILDAESAGIPSGINITAVSREINTCDLVVSVDSIVNLNGIVFKPDDLIKWSGGTNFILYYATDLGANIDALHILSSSRLLLSLDISKSLNGIEIHDESVIETDSSNSFQLLAFEPLVFDESWASADLNALWVQRVPIVDFMFSDGFEN